MTYILYLTEGTVYAFILYLFSHLVICNLHWSYLNNIAEEIRIKVRPVNPSNIHNNFD